MKILFNNLSKKSRQRLTLSIAFLGICSAYGQEKQQDSTKVEKLDEVLVRAVRVDAKSPITHSNVTKEALAKRNLGQDIPMLLNFLPSVVTTTDAGAGIGYTGIRVRGVSSQSTNITINGIPYNDAESLGTFWVNLGDFASSTESLQLQRGVGTSTNGSGAFGASINVLTDAISKDASGEISNSFGSYNTRKHTVKFSTGLMNDHIEIAGRLSNIASDGYIDRASADLKSYFLQGSYVDDNTLIKAITFGGKEVTYQSWNGLEDLDKLENDRTYNTAGEYTDNNGNLQFYDNEVDNYSQDHYQLHWNQRYDNQWSTTLGLNYTKGQGYFEQYKEDEGFDDYGLDPLDFNGDIINETDLIRRRWLDNDFYVINANANYKDDNLNLIFGGSFSHYDGDHFGEVIWAEYASQTEIRDRYYDGNSIKNDLSLFTKANYRLNEKISLYGDLQVRNVTYKTTGTTSDLVEFAVDKDFTFFNPKAGITYSLNTDNDLYFSYARANREPNRTDFESDQTIKPEQLNDFELGWRHKKNNLSFSANTYFMFYNDQLVLTGESDDVGNPIRQNVDKSYRIGLELEAIIPITPKLTLQPNMTISANKVDELSLSFDGESQNLSNTDISFSPSLVAANAIVFQPLENLQMSLLSKYVGEQFMSNTEAKSSKLDSYFINDFNINYTLKTDSIFDAIVFSGLVNNIFNVKYVSNGYYYTYDDSWSNPGSIATIEGAGFYPQATTNFLVGVTLKF
ncbi:Thiamin-regulated outer membrane receptor Omr1 [Winogradskyella psychrotolerans RS-3]|uniref:Thiamin-regulated outer membrane receptor Omr1 n=1 Tax=Winogradskyella psychrotolerans RS-3 TaxID=641526 RepID=S7VV71_9FLAO|nr:TonB-dependent receptor [Winogradskyella psychrotolerans]EPR73242.1 Thiamin-regulated outer membrane receptor Omr1 [Winogradskyella psychrotolerans RS-3]